MQPVRIQESRCVTNNIIIEKIFSQEATPSSGGFQAGPWSKLDSVYLTVSPSMFPLYATRMSY